MKRSNSEPAPGLGARLAERLQGCGYWRNGKPDVRRFCHDRGYLPQYVYGWLKGRVPRMRNLDKLARDLRTSRAWLLFGDASGGRDVERPAGSGLIDLEQFRAVTERLVHLEAELDAVLRAFPDVYLLLDADGTILARKSGQGSTARDEARAGERLETAFPAPVARRLAAGLAEALAAQRLVAVEYSLDEGGETRSYEARFVPLAPARAAGPRALQIVREITERRRVEEVLRASEASFRLLVEDSVQGVFVHRDFTILFANAAAARILGYEAPIDLVGLDPRDPLAPHERARLEGYARARARGEWAPLRYECEAVRPDGQHIWLDAVSSVVAWAGQPALQVTFLDVTERRRAAGGAAALARAGREIVGTLELGEALRRIAATMLELFRVRGAAIFRLEPGSWTLTCVAFAGGDSAERWVGRTLEKNQGVAGRAVLEGRTVWVADVLALDLPAWLREAAAAENRRSGVGVPLRAHGRLIGALGLADEPGRRFSDEELALMATFADHAAVALDNARLYGEARSLAERLETLNQLNRAVSAALGLDQALHAIADAGARLTGAALAAVCVADEPGGALNVRAHVHDGSIARLAATAFSPEGSAVGWVAAHRQTLDIPDVFGDDRIGYPEWWRAYGLTSFLGLPIVHEQALLGVLWLCARRPFRVGPDEERLLAGFAANAAVAILNARVFAESEARRRAAAALADTGRLLSETLDPGLVGQRITDSVRELFGAQSAALYRVEPESGDLLGLAGSGDAGPAFEPGIVMPRGAGLVGLAVRERGPVVTGDLLADPRVRLPAEVRARIEAAPYRAVLAVPLVSKERVVGVLSVADRAGRAFDPEDVRLAQAFAAHAAVALDNARLYAESAQRARDAEELARVARALTESLDVATVADRVVVSAMSLLGVPSCGIRLVDAEDGALVSAGSADRPGRAFAAGHVVPAGAGLSGRAVQEGKSLWSSDVLAEPGIALHDDQRRMYEATDHRAALMVPLRARGRVLGVLILLDRTGRRFSDADIVRAETLADQAALALDNARLYERQRQRAAEQALSLRLAQGFLAARDLAETVSHAARVAADALGADLAGVFLPGPDAGVLRLVGGVGWSPGALPSVVAADALEALDAPLLAAHGVVAGAGVPMVAGAQRVGLLGVYWRSARSAAPGERRLLSLIANQTSVAMAQLSGPDAPGE